MWTLFWFRGGQGVTRVFGGSSLLRHNPDTHFQIERIQRYVKIVWQYLRWAKQPYKCREYVDYWALTPCVHMVTGWEFAR